MEGLFLGIVSLLSWEYIRILRKKEKYKVAYWGERKGRTRVEREMKRIANIRLNTDAGFFVQPIGEISSCYRQCVGTPRQGLLVPASRASITLTRNISPEALDGLDGFSHVWITFQFHLNTNVLKESKAFTGGSTFNAKISLPMLKNGKVKKLGVFSTRSPHRPNPIGITLARIRGVDKSKRILYLNACDLVHGTPVLDIKPYVPAYDAVTDCKVHEWIETTVYTRNEVKVSSECMEQVRAIQGKLCHYKNEPEAFIQGIKETLEAEVRSRFQTSKQMEFTEKGQLVAVLFDETVVRYEWIDERTFEIVQVILKTQDKMLTETVEKIDEEVELEDENNNDEIAVVDIPDEDIETPVN